MHEATRQEAIQTVLVIHVGPHKTGTTSIQTGLAANRERLAASGIVYDVSDDPAGASHAPLAGRIREGDISALDMIERLGPAAVRCLSSETFSYLDADQWRALRDAVPSHVSHVRFAVFIRSRADAMHSRWAESVKWGERRSFPDWTMAGLMALDETPQLDPRPLIDRLPIRNGDELALVDYEAVLEAHGDLVDFMARRVLGYEDPAPLAPGPERNASLPVATTELLRLLQIVHGAAGGDPGIDLFHAVVAARHAVPDFDAVAASVEGAIGQHLREIDLDGLDDLFRGRDDALMEEFAESMTPAPWIPARRRPKPKPYLSDELLLEPAIQTALARLHAVLVAPS